MKVKVLLSASLGVLSLTQTSLSFADNNGKNLYSQRCAVCHGADIKGSGPLANKSNPPTPDLTTSVFKKRLNELSGRYRVIDNTSPKWRPDSQNLAREWCKDTAACLEHSGPARFESIHEQCDFKKSMTLSQSASHEHIANEQY